MQIEELYNLYQRHPSVQTDTRKLKAGDIFFALKGDSFNGNAFAQKAIENGAAYAVIDEAVYAIPGKTILVDDVLATLQQLAKYHRQQRKNDHERAHTCRADLSTPYLYHRRKSQ